MPRASVNGSEATPGSVDRIVGLDVARGLAVIGMLAAHTLTTEIFDWAQPGTWGDVVNGRSSVLFAVLAGISLAIITGRTEPVVGVPLLQARLRIFTRAALIIAIGGILETLGTPVAIILPVYGMLFIVSLPFLRWRSRSLFALASVLAAVMPFVVATLVALNVDAAYEWSWFAELAVLGAYPALTWAAFVLLGLGLGRLDLTAALIQRRLLIAGVALAVAGYGLGSLAWHAWGSAQGAGAFLMSDFSEPTSLSDGASSFDTSSLVSIAPHSGSTFEVVGAAGFALAVIALCLMAAPRIRFALYPLAATGAMALTAYTAQIVILWAVGFSVTGESQTLLFVVLALGTMAVASVWGATLGRGPLERMLTAVSRSAAAIAPGNQTPRRPPSTLDRE